MGALSFSFAEPEEAEHWVREYYELIDSPECEPRGFSVTANVAIVLPMMLHTDEQTAIDRGIDGAHFFAYSLGHFYGTQHVVGGTDLWRSFQADRTEQGFAREIVAPTAAPLAVRLLEAGLGSLRGAIGTPAQVSELLARYEKAGVDQVMFVMQAGKNRHEDICESLELFASDVLPRFTEGREAKEAAKAGRLAEAMERALAKRSEPRQLPAPYPIDEDAETAAIASHGARSAASRRGQPPSLRELTSSAAELARVSARARGQAGARRAVSHASDRRLEQMFGTAGAQRTIFALMTSRFSAERAAGFSGSICYRLAVADGTSRDWTIEISDGQAKVRTGAPASPTVTIGVSVPDFARLMTGVRTALDLMADGKLTIGGDLGVAARLGEMFGGDSPY